jgi:hypothetical protein
MKGVISLLGGCLLGVLLCAPASATPVATYQFQVDELTCISRSGSAVDPASAPCQQERDFFTQRLQSISFQGPSTPGASRFGMLVETSVLAPDFVQPVSAEVNGIRSMDLSGWGVPAGLDEGLCLALWHCRVEADFLSDGALLAGMFRVGTAYDDFFMATTASSPLWSGYINSDGPYMTGGEGARPTFTGQWRLVAEVPEPGTLALLLLPLLWVMLRRQRQPLVKLML